MRGTVSDLSRFRYFQISEFSLLARGTTGDAILDLKSLRVYFIRRWLGSLLQASRRIRPLSHGIESQLGNANMMGIRYIQEQMETLQKHPIIQASELRKLSAVPDHLQHLCIEITSDCNLDCVFCSKDTWFVTRTAGCRRSPIEASDSDALNLEAWKNVMQDARNLGCTSLLVQGGEPLMRPRLTLKVLRYAHDLGFNEIRLWTNGVLLNHEIISCLERLDIGLTIQIVSSEQDIHEATTGNKGTYDKLVYNIASIVAARIPFSIAVPVCNASVRHEDINRKLKRINALAGDLGCHDARVFLQKCRVELPNPEVDIYGKNSLTISWKGEVFSCHSERLANLGNVQNTPLCEILNGRRQRQSQIATKYEPSCEARCEKNEGPSLDLSVEDQLLIDLSRIALTPKVLRRVKGRIACNVNWDAFVTNAKRNRLAGSIYQHCLTHCLQLPKNVVNSLYWDTVKYRIRSFSIFREIRSISRTISGTGKPVVLLGRPGLAQKVIGSPSDCMVDDYGEINLLVPSYSVPDLAAKLRCLSYVPIVEEANGRIREMTHDEISCPSSNVLQEIRLMRVNATADQTCCIKLHLSDLRLGRVNFHRIIENSKGNSTFGPELRVPELADLVLHFSYEFFNRYRCSHRIGYLANTVHQPGALKYLSDVYACLEAYLGGSGHWNALVLRAKDLFMSEILHYVCFYIDLIYGAGTVCIEARDGLRDKDSIEAPNSVKVTKALSSIEELLRSEIRTVNSTFGPTSWLLHPQETCENIVNEIRMWKAEGRSYPTAICTRIELAENQTNIETPADADWSRAGQLVLSQRRTDPRQYFLSHVTMWESSMDVNLCAQMYLLWDRKNLYIRARVSADHDFQYAPQKQVEAYGEQIVLYFSDISDDRMPIKRIGFAIGQGGVPSRALLTPNLSYGGTTIRDIPVEDIQISVRPSRSDYRLDLLIPWKSLNVVPKDGARIGFDVELYHSRGNPQAHTVLTWAGGHGLSMFEPSVHGTLNLLRSNLTAR